LEHGESEFYLYELVNYYAPQDNFTESMPKIDFETPDFQKLDNQIGIRASLLAKYGADILSGNKWFKSKTRELVSDTIYPTGPSAQSDSLA